MRFIRLLQKTPPVVLLLLLSGVLYFFRLGSFTLYDAAETTYGEFIKNILSSGNWLTMHYNGAVIFDKPPLYFWLAAGLALFFDLNEWVIRFWAALAGLLTVITTYFLGRRLYNERTGFFSGLIVMTAFQFMIQSRIAEIDIVLVLLVTLSVLFFYSGYRTGNRLYYLLGYLPMGPAMLIKGILGVALPASTLFFFLLFKKELGKLKEMHLLPGIFIVGLVGLPWYLVEYLRHGQVFLDFAIGFLFLSRFSGAVCGHTGPWYYYFLVLLLGFAPWSYLLPLGLWRTYLDRKNEAALFLLCFIIPTFIVFSIAKTKIPNYILPLYPFLAIITGKLWDDLCSGAEPSLRKGFTWANAFFFIIIILLFIGAIIAGTTTFTAQYGEMFPHVMSLVSILASGGIIYLFAFNKKNYFLAFAIIPALVFAIVFFLTTLSLPKVENYLGGKELGKKVTQHITPGKQIAAFNVGNRPSVVYYNIKPVIFLNSEKDVNAFLAAKKGYCFTTIAEYDKKLLQGRVFAKKGDLIVLY